MRMKDAEEMMRAAAGYRVHFEKREDGMLCSDYFPWCDEPPIAEETDAWKLASKFAAIDPDVFVNVYVISAFDSAPVNNYASRKLNPHPTPAPRPA
jgi:hypothetical protein